MSAVKVLRCPIRHQFAAMKAPAKTHSIWCAAILAVREPHKLQWFTHKSHAGTLRALLMKTCVRTIKHGAQSARRTPPDPPPSAARILSMMIKARAESGNQRSVRVFLFQWESAHSKNLLELRKLNVSSAPNNLNPQHILFSIIFKKFVFSSGHMVHISPNVEDEL